jgi:hypothetical protein
MAVGKRSPASGWRPRVRKIELVGDLTAEQREDLASIDDK